MSHMRAELRQKQERCDEIVFETKRAEAEGGGEIRALERTAATREEYLRSLEAEEARKQQKFDADCTAEKEAMQ